MEQTEKRKVIMVDLDSLLDTRFALMVHLDLRNGTNYAIPTVLNNAYQTRKSDEWIANQLQLPYEEWMALWDKRHTLNILPLSTQTFTIKAILAYIDECVAEQMKPTTGYDFDLMVNTYPYQLPEEDCREIEAMLDEQAPIFGSIKTTYLTPTQLSPSFFKDSLESYWTYDLRLWTNAHLEWLLNNPRPTIQLVSPKLIHPIPKSQELTEDDKVVIEKIDPFELTVVTLSPFVSVHLQDVQDYCVHPDYVRSFQE